jgi:hypothetical protein
MKDAAITRKIAHLIPGLGRTYRRLSRPIRFMKWVFLSSSALLKPMETAERRLLGIYDFTYQPFSVGDILMFHEGCLVMREKHNIDKVDVAFVFNPVHPVSSDPAFATINQENFALHLSSLLPVVQINQHLGSVLIFNSHLHLQQFIADNADRYFVWPTAWKYATREYLYYTVFDELLYNYYEEKGTIPKLNPSPILVNGAYSFCREHVSPYIPVTVQIRNNKFFTQGRNLDVGVWLDFFHHCEQRYPVKFVIIGARNEIDARLQKCSNVVVAKDHFTTVEQDLALIHAAAIHMGADSGPAVMALLGEKPYLIVNTIVGQHYFSRKDMVRQEDNFLQFWFAGPFQRYVKGRETVDLLITEFAKMWEGVDFAEWERWVNDEAAHTDGLSSWLR